MLLRFYCGAASVHRQRILTRTIMDNQDRQADTGKPHFIIRLFDRVLDLGKFIGMIMILLTCIGICVHVLLRYFFDLPLNWTIDISTLFMFYITFLGTAWLLREDGHVSLDFLFHAIGPQKFGRLEILTNLICSFACLIIVYYGILETKLAIELEVAVDMPLAPPKWIVLIFIPYGFLLLAMEFLRKVVKSLKANQRAKESG